MKTKKYIFLIYILTITIFAHAQQRPTASSMNADQIVNTYLNNIGGADNWKAVSSMISEGNLIDRSFNKVPIVHIHAAPNRHRLEMIMQDYKVIEAYDGMNGWFIEPFYNDNNPQPLPAEKINQYANYQIENIFIDYKQKGHRLKYTGDKDILGTMCYELKMTKRDGTLEVYYLEKEYMIPIMLKQFIVSGPNNGQSMETYFSDYRVVDGLVMPFNTEIKINGQTYQRFSLTSVSLNVPINHSVFTHP